MSKERPKYYLKISLHEVPEFILGNYSGKLNIKTEVLGASKEQIHRQLEQLLAAFHEPWQRPRDSKGHFIKAKESNHE